MNTVDRFEPRFQPGGRLENCRAALDAQSTRLLETFVTPACTPREFWNVFVASAEGRTEDGSIGIPAAQALRRRTRPFDDDSSVLPVVAEMPLTQEEVVRMSYLFLDAVQLTAGETTFLQAPPWNGTMLLANPARALGAEIERVVRAATTTRTLNADTLQTFGIIDDQYRTPYARYRELPSHADLRRFLVRREAEISHFFGVTLRGTSASTRNIVTAIVHALWREGIPLHLSEHAVSPTLPPDLPLLRRILGHPDVIRHSTRRLTVWRLALRQDERPQERSMAATENALRLIRDSSSPPEPADDTAALRPAHR